MQVICILHWFLLSFHCLIHYWNIKICLPHFITGVEYGCILRDVQLGLGKGNIFVGKEGWLNLEELMLQYLGLYGNLQVCFYGCDCFVPFYLNRGPQNIRFFMLPKCCLMTSLTCLLFITKYQNLPFKQGGWSDEVRWKPC